MKHSVKGRTAGINLGVEGEKEHSAAGFSCEMQSCIEEMPIVLVVLLAVVTEGLAVFLFILQTNAAILLQIGHDYIFQILP